MELIHGYSAFLFGVCEEIKVNEQESLESIINRKCSRCFRRDAEQDSCLLVRDRHPGIELCLGPFKDQADRLRKLREDFEQEKKPEADLDRAIRVVLVKDYLRKKKLFDDSEGR
jgi:hypothetical protein